jgi:hypothetical protein
VLGETQRGEFIAKNVHEDDENRRGRDGRESWRCDFFAV